jgi:FMNH2-dependent dimethyl sulfone monooxygenase
MDGEMRFGIWAPAPQTIRADAEIKPGFEALRQHGGGVDASFLYAVEVLQRAEQLGFDISLIAQRYLGPDIDSWIFATALAARTQSIELMAAVHPGIADPRIIAKMGASIDRVSGGRFCVNIVNGTRPHEHSAFGTWIDQTQPRYRRMDEFIKIMKGLWREDDFSFHGEFYDFEHAGIYTKSVRAPHPPIYAASRVEDGMEVVARECQAWFVNYDKDRGKYAESLKRIEHEIGLMEGHARALGKQMTYGINAIVLLGETDEEAEAKADEHLTIASALQVGTSGLGANLVGSPRTVAERIRRYEDLGIGLLMLHFYPMRAGLDEFAEKVMPRL